MGALDDDDDVDGDGDDGDDDGGGGSVPSCAWRSMREGGVGAPISLLANMRSSITPHMSQMPAGWQSLIVTSGSA